jgi:hypothetical protein
MLGQVADALGEKGVSIRAFMAAVMDGRGFIRVVVDRPAIAKRIFAAHGWKTTDDEVIEVTVPDRPGSVGRVADRLGEAGINILYAYLGTASAAKKMNLYLAVNDVKAAVKALG